MTGFIQVVEFETSDIEAVTAALQRFREDSPGALLASHATIVEDRDRPGTYMSIVEFASYDDAMRQSANPATDAFSKELAQLMVGPPRFRNLEVHSVLENPAQTA